jgi:hypothetical protein
VPGLPARHPDMVTDGLAYAWLRGNGIAWYSPAAKQTVVLAGFPGAGIKATVRAVSGPCVLVDAGSAPTFTWIIDTRTGAAAETEYAEAIVSGNGVLAYSSSRAVILRVDRLPGLTC